MGKFDGILICTDLDGTLLRKDKTISEANTEAIEYFKAQGGIFTFVTGRMPFFVSYVVETVKPNAPFGCINGSGLYDSVRNEYVSAEVMPDSVIELVRHIDKNFATVGIQVNTFDKIYFCKENRAMADFRRETKVEHHVCDYNDVREPIAKIVFGTDSDDEVPQIAKMLKAHPLADEFDFIQSERNLYEILPKGIGKGTAIRNLCKHLNLDIDKTVAVGDYNNDISMLETAKIGIAVSNACKELLEVADFVSVSNEEDAIAQIISDLETGKFGL